MHEVHYCREPVHVKIFEGTGAALRKLKEKGFKLLVVTNQSGIGRGYFSEPEYRAVHEELLHQLGNDLIDDAYFCEDAPENASTRRKPAIGMVLEAQRDHAIDLRRSFFVGDKAIDVACGKAAGVRTILVRTGYGVAENDCAPDWTARDLNEASEIIIAHAHE